VADALAFEFDAFISYASSDFDRFGPYRVDGFVERLRARLEEYLGRPARIFFISRGERRDGIEPAIHNAATMVALVTPGWPQSKGAQSEFEQFASTGRPLLPVGLQPDLSRLLPKRQAFPLFTFGEDLLSATASQASMDKLIDELAQYLAKLLPDPSPSPVVSETDGIDETDGADRPPVDPGSSPPPLGPDSGASIFFANPDGWNSEWLASLAVGEILFWIKGGTAHLKRLKRGGTVVLLAGRDPTPDDPSTGAVVALGVLAAGADTDFRDNRRRRRWPVLITHLFPRDRLPRLDIERELGAELIRAAAGGVHTLDVAGARVLARRLARVRGASRIPFSEAEASAALDRGETVEAALARHPNIQRVGAPGAEPERRDAYAQLLSDAPSKNQDLLDRGALALFLARRMHIIWCEWNGHSTDPNAGLDEKPKARPEVSDTFIAHIDAPWGGGKTTFANFVARVLNPSAERLDPGHFLKADVAPRETDETKLRETSLDGVFLSDYPATSKLLRPPGRRPWIIVEANAWRDQYIQPPWWQIYVDVTQSVRHAILDDARRRFAHAVKPGVSLPWRMAALVSGVAAATRWLGTYAASAWYTLTNVKVRRQLGLTAAAVAILLGVYWGLLSPKSRAALDSVTKVKDGISLAITALGSLAAVGTVIAQSIDPDLDFSSETKQVGVSDPVARFRKMFGKILRLGRRPVLLIVDDLDRVESKAVVELLRGFQTIVRSPRLFVLILGDRKWIENAHTVTYKDLAAVNPETQSDLGVRFVEKLFQLSFTLPAMTPAMRRRYTMAQVGGAPVAAGAPAVAAPAAKARAAEATANEAIDDALSNQATPVRQREQQVSQIIAEATKAGADTPELQASASRKLVAAAGADVAYKKEVENILSGLGPLMPGNPRQIKRIINAFAVLENVGRLYFSYQLTSVGPEGERRARRWRQLALWVALAIDRPEVWRQLARSPQLLDAAFASKASEAAAALSALTKDLDKAGVARVKADVGRFKADPGLQRLLGVYSVGEAADTPAQIFAQTRIETAAVFEFNRIMWEPGFAVED